MEVVKLEGNKMTVKDGDKEYTIKLFDDMVVIEDVLSFDKKEIDKWRAIIEMAKRDAINFLRFVKANKLTIKKVSWKKFEIAGRIVEVETEYDEDNDEEYIRCVIVDNIEIENNEDVEDVFSWLYRVLDRAGWI